MSLFNFRNCCYGDSKASGVDKDLPQSHEDSLLGLRVDLIKKACALAFKAHKSPKKYYLLEKKNRSWLEADLIIISFHGSWASSDWFVDKSYGVTKINQQLFPSLKSIGNDEAALVNEAFQLRFESILSNSSLKHEVKEAMTKGKQLMFTGHSSGAAMAILATLWVLEEYLTNNNKNKNHKLPQCITFGSPLIGNHIFSHATRRENWSHHFTHFITTLDIMPRILFAPFHSIQPIFSSILQLFNPKSKSSGTDSETDRVISEFYSTVMRNTATVTSYVISNLMDDTNLLLETLPNLVDLSPYRPFGNFIFCAADRPPVVVRNSDVVLQLLFYTARINDMSEVSDVSKKSIMQHLRYEVELQQSFEISNVVYLDQLEELSLAADGSNRLTVSTALDSFGLDTIARLRLRAAGEWQKQKYKNEEKVNREFNEKAAATMKHLKDYKETCEISYYDAFKVHKDERDFKANVKRLELAGVWDHIMEMLKKYELPDEFESKAEWIERGTMYRTLVEPLDVANYYRHFKDKDGGPYMDKGSRPKRYRYLQRWLEHAGRMKSEDDYSESCFWAELEEIWKEINDNNGSFEDVKERVLKLETRIKEWFEKGKLDKDVLFEGSTLVNWWKALPPNHKKESPIRSLVEMSQGINMQ
ncbi:protein EDS1L isoform X2 [Arachis duranensis]|uniref:Protein EDS1L isoform X2 n=1 Tax=Arachis duranensis TaxID=130453 RepID=A0A6P4DPJ0_ARADU|nr:protein EDS1L isoform X2 [Arachis duranensis]